MVNWIIRWITQSMNSRCLLHRQTTCLFELVGGYKKKSREKKREKRKEKRDTWLPYTNVDGVCWYYLLLGTSPMGGCCWFHGLMDDLSIWTVPLEEEDIKRLMFQRLGGKEEGLFASWSFNEGKGQTVHDVSPARRHGKVKGNAVQWVEAENKGLILNSCL